MTLPEPPDRRHWLRAALDEYEGRLVRYAARITGNLESARDAVQETFARLCTQDAASLNGRLAPWLFAVCRNRAIELRRKESRMHSVSQSVFDAVADRQVPPDDAAAANEAASGLTGMIATLSADQQEVVRLKFQEKMSYKEIAEVTGHSISNVGFLLHTAIRKLRQRMGEGVEDSRGRGAE